MTASITTISTPRALRAGAVAAAGVREGARPGVPAGEAKLRLTRRGRAVVGSLGTLGVIAALAVAAMFSSSEAVASAAPSNNVFGYVVVQPGESLWQVASGLDSTMDPRDLVAEIVRLNQLEGSGVQAGQPVAVPLRYAQQPGVVSASDLGL